MRSDLSLSVAVVIAILCSNFTCHQAEIHRKVIRTGEESRACVMNQTLNLMNDIRSAAQQSSDGLSSGSWGSWGPWGECSRSCGGGVREQIRSCLPRSGSRPPVHPPQTGVRVQVPEPHRHTAAENTESNLSRRADQRPQGVSATGRRRANDGRISLRMYGYSRIPNGTPLRKDSDRTPRNRQRRSASSYPQQNHRPHHRNTHQIHRQNTLHKPHRRLTWAPVQQRNPAHNTQPHPITPDTPTSGPARPDGTLLNIFCPGSSAQHKLCNTKACPSSGRPIRDVQCSAFNTQPFMGKLYEWEPFHDVPADQRCELNCRAAGFRFYIRQSERVIDGTPCGQNETSVCVRGACQSAGCDDLLGSGKVQDKCGVCGGDNSGCKLISGLFQHSLSKVGYHKIIEIPEGATKINVTEMEKSRNYLALRSRSGRSIINGNWAIDRPGMYEGVGTMFTYRRPNEISSTAGESFLAEGPTNEILDVYMIYQQPNPGVHYEFIMPSDLRAAEQNQREAHVNRQTGSDPNGLNNQDPPPVPDNRLPAAPPPHRQREYNWKLTGTSDCSATCGRGSRYTVFSCVQRLTHTPVPNSLCDSSTKPSQQEEPCNTQPCPAFWDVGEWSECSKTCGLGLQHRQILCRQVYANRTLNVHTSRCQHLERPDTSATCQLKICSEWQIHSEWSPCSVPCGVGQRSREVYCVSNVGDIVADEECNMKLRPSDVENCDAGSCTRSWFFSAWGDQCSAECGVGVRTRSVLCMNNHISSLPLEGCGSERPSEVQPCNNGPCERRTEWFTGPWSQCSAACGSGSQQRAVVCLMRSGEDFTVLPPYECSSLDRPLSQQSCLIKACGAQWYHTDWSVCSKTCDRGYRVREVRCLSNDMITSDSCEERLKPDVKEECNPEPCLPLIDEKCRDKYFNCNVVVQARLCVYDYYKMACCASCTRVMQRNSERWRHR